MSTRHNMKKSRYIILIFCILLLLFFLSKIKREHTVNYSINKKYDVYEYYYKYDNEFNYDFVIKKDKFSFTYTLNPISINNKKIIKDIKYFKKSNLVCILPIYKKNIASDLYCNLDKKQVSNYYLYSTNNSLYKSILKQVKKYNVSINYKNAKKEDYKSLGVYKNNIKDGYNYIVWDYNGIYILNNDKMNYQKIIDYDLYDNIMYTITDKYYVLFENTSVNGIKNIYYYDIRKNKLKKYEPNLIISKDSYINGVIGEDIYVTDRDKKIQYTVNVDKKEITQISFNNSFTVFDNGKEKKLNKSDFFMEDIYYEKKDFSNNYKYYLKDNRMYKKYSKGKEILLFELDDIKDWKVIDYDILLVSGDIMYLYNDKDGLKKIVKSNELRYNYKNIYDLWKK